MTRLSRRKRLDAEMTVITDACDNIESAIEAVRELQEEIQDWQGNLEANSMEHLPKYDEVTECVDQLETFVDTLDAAREAMVDATSEDDVDFPGMY